MLNCEKNNILEKNFGNYRRCTCLKSGNFARMFERLQKKWKVTGPQLVLVLCTFAIGGSLCGYLTRLIIQPIHIENAFLYGTLYFVLLTLLWPLCVLVVSVPFGQLPFFRNYLRKMGQRLGIGRDDAVEAPVADGRVHIALFASGTGSNALRLMEYFKNHATIQVAMLVSNRAGAGALHHASNHGVSTLIVEKEKFFRGDAYVPELQAAHIDFIVLAGFLWKIPTPLIQAYPQRMINLHPALLPKYGGKGMYGHHVHEAVLAAGEEESGITIHYVNSRYDEGAIIFQAMCPVEPTDTVATLTQKIHALEHKHLPVVVEQVVRG